MNALFDSQARKFFGPATHGETHFSYLNRSARDEATRVRNLLERWFQEYPQACRRDLSSRFRARDEHHQLAAFFELYLYALLRGCSYSPQVHPDLPGERETSPDFLAEGKSKPFFLEATLISNSQTEAGQLALLNRLYDALNQLDSPDFFLHIKLSGKANSDPPGRKLRKAVRDFLEQQDPDECSRIIQERGLSALPAEEYEHDGLVVRFVPVPKSPGLRGKSGVRPIGSYSPQGGWVNHSLPLKRAIEKKASKYGNLGEPFIIALNVVSDFIDEIDVMEALFGEEQWLIGRECGDRPQMRRRKNGALTRFDGPTNTRVSAVLITQGLNPWTIGTRMPRLYHNPWAKHPCLEELQGFPSYVPSNGSMVRRQGTLEGNPFGLPKDWPQGR